MWVYVCKRWLFGFCIYGKHGLLSLGTLVMAGHHYIAQFTFLCHVFRIAPLLKVKSYLKSRKAIVLIVVQLAAVAQSLKMVSINTG
jgi:hypothetical protein